MRGALSLMLAAVGAVSAAGILQHIVVVGLAMLRSE